MNRLCSLSENQLKISVENLCDAVYENKTKNKGNTTWVAIKVDDQGDVIEELIRYGERNDENIAKTVLANRVNEIIESAEEILKSPNDEKLQLYGFLQNLYEQTTPMDRQVYFHRILDIYYNISEESRGKLTEGIFKNLVKTFLPYIKLQNVIKELGQRRELLNSSIQGLLECVMCPRILREDCYLILLEKLKTTDYEMISFDMVLLGEVLGFVGSYFNLNISIEQNNVKKDVGFFVKCLPLKDSAFRYTAFDMFKKEVFLYEELMPKIKKLGIDGISNFAPQFYFARPNDVLVLEDMTAQHFHPLNNSVPVGYDILAAMIKTLSDFHACSLILDNAISKKDRNATLGKKYKQIFDEVILNRNCEIGAAFQCAFETISDYFLGKFPSILKTMSMEEFKNNVSSEIELMYKNVGPSEKYFNVIFHRDLWGGNILTTRKKSLNCCVFIDYQVITYSPPAVDLLFLFYTNTDKVMRENSMPDLIDLYYSNLKDNLMKYEVDLQEICKYEHFLEMINNFKCASIIQALAHLQALLCPSVKELKNNQEKFRKFQFEDRSDVFDKSWDYAPFKTRIEELIEDLCEILENK